MGLTSISVSQELHYDCIQLDSRHADIMSASAARPVRYVIDATGVTDATLCRDTTFAR